MKNELLEIAAAALKVDSKDIKDNFKELPEINACYFWVSGRGGISVIVNENGEKLSATSRVSLDLKMGKEINNRRKCNVNI